jgi:hypothetical protein
MSPLLRNPEREPLRGSQRFAARTARRFPPPWTIDEPKAACFILRDANGQALGYFYFEDDPGRP